MKDVREILKKRPLLFDGGMGTYYKAKPGQECEQANLLDPDGILTVHRAYLEAGADAIKTNTFGLPRMAAAQNPMWEAMADEGWKLAAQAAAMPVWPKPRGRSKKQCRMPLCWCPLQCCRTATPARAVTAQSLCAA